MISCPNCKSTNTKIVFYPNFPGHQGIQGPVDRIFQCYSCNECGIRFDKIESTKEEITTYEYEDIITDEIVDMIRKFSSHFKEFFLNSEKSLVLSIYGHLDKSSVYNSLVAKTNSVVLFLTGLSYLGNPLEWKCNDISINGMRNSGWFPIKILNKNGLLSPDYIRKHIKFMLVIGHYRNFDDEINKYIHSFRTINKTWKMDISNEIIGPDGETTRISFFLR